MVEAGGVGVGVGVGEVRWSGGLIDVVGVEGGWIDGGGERRGLEGG